MARTLSIAAYIASLRRPDRTSRPVVQPPRPEGAIIWARCSHPDQLTAIETLDRKLSEDADQVQIVATLRNWESHKSALALPEPQGKANIRAFLAHWKPIMGIWVRGDIDLVLLDEMRAAKLPLILVDASGDGLDQVAGGWVPGAIRSSLSEFEAVLAIDTVSATRLITAGAPREVVYPTGAMEDCPAALPCDESERRATSEAIGTRPVWLVTGAQLDESQEVARAHQEASRRAHRLLLVAVPQNPDHAYQLAINLRQAGFHTTLRSQEREPQEPTQVYVVDTEDDLGMWYRIAPITFLGGTLRGGGCRDPFEATAHGSVVLYGPQVAPFQRHVARLNAAGASRLIRSGKDLGGVVEHFLAADKAAEVARAAWDVTTRGANVTNRIAALIRQRLEGTVE